VFLRTETGIEQLRKHLRGFLRVRDEAGRRLIFRYYDPRVLRVYLPLAGPSNWRPFRAGGLLPGGRRGRRRDGRIPAQGGALEATVIRLILAERTA